MQVNSNPGYRHFVVVIVLLAMTAVTAIFQANVPVSNQTGILTGLPERVGGYTGVDLLFCQNEQCAESFSGDTVAGVDRCAKCGAALDTVSIAERSVLPEDTVIIRKRYMHPVNPPITVSIVFSGTEQRSIHRPQQCLPAQGMTIEYADTISIPLEGRKPLKVMFLGMRNRRGRTRENSAHSCYAYWFAGLDRETPYHLQRLFWMASDRVFRNISYRWAYIALATARVQQDSDEDAGRITRFITELYPMMHKGMDQAAD